jgi:hypothetical protein
MKKELNEKTKKKSIQARREIEEGKQISLLTFYQT